MDTALVFAGADQNANWFFKKYYHAGDNGRYFTFQLALNLLNQRFISPVILETGCQRQPDDLGAGMSTTIFAEYLSRYSGQLICVDNNARHLEIAKECVSSFHIEKKFELSDSVRFLREYTGPVDLLYLDSYDYPIVEIQQRFAKELRRQGRPDWSAQDIVASLLDAKATDQVIKDYEDLILPCQEHCLQEFKVIEDRLSKDIILLIDDNGLAGGGKPGLLKKYLLQRDWICLLDLQQTLWIRK